MRGIAALTIAALLPLSTAWAQDWSMQAHEDFFRGQHQKAEDSLNHALQANPFDPVALNNLAVAKAEQGDYHSSLSLLERAHELAPDNPDIQINLTRMRGWVMTYAGNEAPPYFGGQRSPQRPPSVWD